jgi:FAD binding domain
LPHEGPTGPLPIIGAGPTGLTAALELSRLGVEVRIVDDGSTRAAVPQAIGMSSLTLDVFAQRGLDQEILRRSNQVIVGAVYGDHGLVGKVPLNWPESRRLNWPESPHHCRLLVNQAEASECCGIGSPRRASESSTGPRWSCLLGQRVRANDRATRMSGGFCGTATGAWRKSRCRISSAPTGPSVPSGACWRPRQAADRRGTATCSPILNWTATFRAMRSRSS